MAEYSFPVETIDLPSQGKYYPEGSPLRSGKIDIKYMTAKEEDILTSTNLIQKGTVIDKLMESLIATKGVKPDDLLIGDANAVMIAARILAYGKDYPVDIICNSCSHKFEYVVDLTKLTTSEPTENAVNGEFEFELPTKVKVTYRLLTRKDERDIVTEVNTLKKFNNSIEPDTSTRLKYIITSVNGNRETKIIREFAENMIVRDVRALRQEIKRVSPDVDFDLKGITCDSCEADIKVRMPFGANFFWPDSRA